MKSIIRAFIFNIICIYFAGVVIPGFSVSADFKVLVFASILLTLINLIIKPLAKILFFPINLITLGLFSWVINALIIYALVFFIPQIKILPWTFGGADIKGFVIPSLYFTFIMTIILVSFFISILTNILNWLRK